MAMPVQVRLSLNLVEVVSALLPPLLKIWELKQDNTSLEKENGELRQLLHNNGNNRGTLPLAEHVPARDITPSMTLSKATVDFLSAVMAFMRELVLVLRKSNADNSCTV